MRKKQLRGQALKSHIAAGIKFLAAEAGAKYVYNASKLSDQIGVSRPTLARHIDFINSILEDLSAGRRLDRGEGAIQMMREKMQRLEAEKVALKKEIEVLQAHHASIYLSVYQHAHDLEPLIRRTLEEEMLDNEKCILCGREIEEVDGPIPPKPSKLIKFPELSVIKKK